MSFITLILVISILVFVHELGHFIAAKRSGVRVDEFSVGFPPRIWSKQVGETLYSLNLIPFGGYVKIFGENPDADSIAGPDKERSFVNKKRHLQAYILVAGVVMNILFAWVLLSLSFVVGVNQAGVDSSRGEYVMVTEVVKDSPAEISGLHAGDLLKSVAPVGKTDDSQKISTHVVKQVISESLGTPLEVMYVRGATVATTTITPKLGIVKDEYGIGVGMADIDTVRLPIHKALIEGALTTYNLFVETTKGTLGFFAQAFAFNANLKDVSGPVGIAGYLNQAREFGFSTLLAFVAMISINLAVINLFPFPALDGGRLLIVGIEAIIRRPINPKITNILNLIGFVFLMGLMVTITVSDIGKLF